MRRRVRENRERRALGLKVENVLFTVSTAGEGPFVVTRSPGLPPRPRPEIYHGAYTFDLSRQSHGFIHHEFRKMLGTDLIVCRPIRGFEEHLEAARVEAALRNNAAAKLVEYTDVRTWTKRKIIIWRGCWCVRLSEVRNKRLKLSKTTGQEARRG